MPQYVYGEEFDWDAIPQRFAVSAGSWSWGMPTGITQYDTTGPLSPAVEGQLVDQEFHAQTIARSLDGVGGTAWIFNTNKYNSSFGSWPSNPAYAVPISSDFQWLAVDDQSVVQWFHPAYGVYVDSSTPPSHILTEPAALDSYIVDMIDSSANVSGATPWRTYDLTAIAALDTYPDYFLSYDYRCYDTSTYSVPFGDCFGGDETAWQSLAVTFGNSVLISIQRNEDGKCYWKATVKLKPRFSMWSNAKLARVEYYHQTAGKSPGNLVAVEERTMYASGYIDNGAGTGGLTGWQRTYPGRFGYVHPAAPASGGSYQDWLFGKGWAVPPYLINLGAGTSFEGAFAFNDGDRLRNRGGPVDLSTLSSDPPGGWRSWIELTYLSANPIRCKADIEDAEEITMELQEVSPVVGQSWSTWLGHMSTAFGLATPPSTMTIQRLADVT